MQKNVTKLTLKLVWVEHPVRGFEVRYFWRIRGEGVILNSEAFQVWIFPSKVSNVVVFALDKSPAEPVPISVFL